MSNSYFSLDQAKAKLGRHVRLLAPPDTLPCLPVGSIGFVNELHACRDGYMLGVTWGNCIKSRFDRVEWELLEEVDM